MRPQLVDYDKIFKKKQPVGTITVKCPTTEIQQVGSINFFINLFGLVILIGGISLLYYRKINKEENKKILRINYEVVFEKTYELLNTI